MTARAPSHLDKPGRALWRTVVAEYDLEGHQLAVLEAAAMAADRMHTAAALVRDEGMTTTDRYGAPKVHPAVAIERDARLGMARCLRELALAVDGPGASFEARPPRIRPA